MLQSQLLAAVTATNSVEASESAIGAIFLASGDTVTVVSSKLLMLLSQLFILLS